MFNFIVIGDDESWLKSGQGIVYKSRFPEYTTQETLSKLPNDNSSILDHIKKLPTLFTYEGDNSKIFLTYIDTIQVKDKWRLSLLFKVNDLLSFDFADIEENISKFDIKDFEKYRQHWSIKSGDLKDLINDYTKIDKYKKNSLIEYIDQNSPSSQARESPSITVKTEFIDLKVNNLNVMTKLKTIESVKNFIELIITDDDNKDANRINFYRGHSNSDYKLEPSLLRKNTNTGEFFYLEQEDIIYRELLSNNFNDFHEDSSTFDRLVRMQHFSLPTRLLDITSNPLIALYFACKGNEDKKADVISINVSNKSIKYFDSDTATCIANLCKLTLVEKEKIDFQSEDENHKKIMERLLHYIKEDKPYFEDRIKDNIKDVICIKSKFTNPRINAQSGSFLLFGLDAKLEDENDFDFKINHYLIQPENKSKILRELDLLNINESTVFPYLENSAKYISNKFKKN
jgi:hypothetical protein